MAYMNNGIHMELFNFINVIKINHVNMINYDL
jgi:hypothetical protein